MQASFAHPLGEAIIPKVLIDCTHEKAAEVIGAGGKESLLKHALVKNGETCERKESTGLAEDSTTRLV